MSKTVTSQLRNFMSLQINYVTTETLKVLRDIFRKYPEYFEDFLIFFTPKLAQDVHEVDGKVSLCWIIGEFGQKIQDSPYMLEKMLEDLKEVNSAELNNSLMSACFKLFFKRAPETKKILASVFQFTMNNSLDTNVKQTAIFLYKLMKTNLQAAQQLACCQNSDFEIFFEDKSDESRDRIFWEFNSLSVIYQKPSERFLKENVLKHVQAAEKKYFPQRQKKHIDDEGEVQNGKEVDDLLNLNQPTASNSDDLLGGFQPS